VELDFLQSASSKVDAQTNVNYGYCRKEIKLQIPGGKAYAAPPVVPCFLQGVNIGQSSRSSMRQPGQKWVIIPVDSRVYDDRTFTSLKVSPHPLS